MKHVRSLEDVQLNQAWVTIGAFDGVHLGHQAIIRKLTAGAHAQGAPAVVLTFDPHPTAVLRPERMPPLLSSPDEKADYLNELGVDVLVTHPFTHEFAQVTAEKFVQQLLEHLGMRQLWVGYDFAMGRNRQGNITALQAFGEALGFTLHVVGAQANGQAVISSSRIRALLAEGDVDKASMLLGRPYRLCGDVIQGAQRGRTIGIPTANIQVPITRATPGTGVYVCEARVGGIVRRAAVNIGKRPTFELADVPISVEAHLLDYAGDLYGQTLELAFLSRLRGEQKFDTVDALIAQIREDVEAARTFSNPHA